MYGWIVVVVYALTLGAFAAIPGGLTVLSDILVGTGHAITAQAKSWIRGLRIAVIVFLAIYIGLNLAFITAYLSHNTGTAIVMLLITAAVTYPLFGLLNTVTVITQRRPPVQIANMVLLPMTMAITGLLQPTWFYGWFAVALIAAMIVAVAFQIVSALNRSTQFYAPYVMLLWMVFVFVSIPLAQPIRAAAAWTNLGNSILGRSTIATELAARKPNEVIADKANLWKVKFADDGTPLPSKSLNDGGVQRTVSKGFKFKTCKTAADTVDLGGQLYIQICPPDPVTGEYVYEANTVEELNKKLDNMDWVAVEATDVGKENQNSSASTSGTSDSNSSSTSGNSSTGVRSNKTSMAADEVYNTRVFVKRGQRVKVKAVGRVNASSEATPNDGANKWVGPKGWSTNPAFNDGRSGPLPDNQPFMALCGRFASDNPPLNDGRWKYIGDEQTLVADQDGYLFLMVNDKVGDITGLHMGWLQNNTGQLAIEVQLQ